jgi:hypothetical protein
VMPRMRRTRPWALITFTVAPSKGRCCIVCSVGEARPGAGHG